jgi:hypothetical protein
MPYRPEKVKREWNFAGEFLIFPKTAAEPAPPPGREFLPKEFLKINQIKGIIQARPGAGRQPPGEAAL